MKHNLIFKIATAEEWQSATEQGVYTGSADDERDGFIHFSTADQLASTLAKHFTGQRKLLLISFDAASFGDALKWEPSRGGALFPHVYATVDPAMAQQSWALAISDTGEHSLPQDIIELASSSAT